MAETVTIGDREVEIRETEDGFEAVEAEEEDEPSLFITASSEDGRYGFKIPLGADLLVHEVEGEAPMKHDYAFAWKTDDDVSDMKNSGSSEAKRASDRDDAHDFDGYAATEAPEVVIE